MQLAKRPLDLSAMIECCAVDVWLVARLDGALECSGLTLEASKVLKNVVDLIATDGSPYTLAVPKGALTGLPDEVEWSLAEHALGHESILSNPAFRTRSQRHRRARAIDTSLYRR
jgi:hypothetical protein